MGHSETQTRRGEKPCEEGGGDVAESCATPEPPGGGRGRKHPFLEPLEEEACSHPTAGFQTSGSGLREKAFLKAARPCCFCGGPSKLCLHGTSLPVSRPPPGPPSRMPCELDTVPMSPSQAGTWKE